MEILKKVNMKHQDITMSDQLPLVSIGMPIYNVEQFLERSLLSVLNQTYRNVEILAIDDCGKDHSMEIVERLRNNHPNGSRIRVIRQPQNMGQGEARNAVFDHANGKYVYLLDSDDYIESNTIEIMVHEAEKNQADVVHAVARTVYFGSDRVDQDFPYQPYKIIKGKDEFAKVVCADLRRHVSFCCWNILYNVDFLRRNNLRFFRVKCEDVLFFSDYYSCVECAVMMPNVTYNYLVRGGSTMGYMQSGVIPARDIRMWFEANKLMLQHTDKLRNRTFFDVHCARVLKWNFRSVCVALRHRSRFDDYLTNSEISSNLLHPATIKEILGFHRYRMVNLLFKLIGLLPAWLCVKTSYLIGKIIRWI